MSVEILSVSLSPETIEELANRVAFLVSGGLPTTQSNPPSSQNPQGAAGPASGGNGDPWQNQPQQGQQQYQQGPQQGQQYQGPQQGGQQYQQGGQQNCAHGPMTFVPAGTNRNTGEAYNAYYKCPLQRGAQGRCRNVYV